MRRAVIMLGIVVMCGAFVFVAIPRLHIGPSERDVNTSAPVRGDRAGSKEPLARNSEKIKAEADYPQVSDLKFTHLTTNDGLSQGYVTAILQDRRGFMWFATRDGLNRYDGNTFVVYKHNPNDPGTLNSNFIQDLMEDGQGYLWVVTNTGLNRFDPVTERCTRYLHDPKNPNSIAQTYVTSIARDDGGYLWLGTEDSGFDRLDPGSGTFTHYRSDSDGHFPGRVTQLIKGRRGDIWFVGEGGLFHLNPQTGKIARLPATRKGLSADSVFEDEAGSIWVLAQTPITGLVKYDPQTEQLTEYPFDAPINALASSLNGGSAGGKLASSGQNGLWVPSSRGLYYFDWRTKRFTSHFRHEEGNPASLDSDAILSVYRDRGGLLWVGTENAGLNLLNFGQEQFHHYRHHPTADNSLSAGRVKAILQDPDGVLWLGFFPRALDRFDRRTGRITHYVPNPAGMNTLSKGTNVDSIYRDAAGYLWIGGGGAGLDRFDERTGRFKHYGHNPDDPHSLPSDNVYTIYGDRDGVMWVGHQYGISRYDSATDGFISFQLVPNNPANLANWVWSIYQDRAGALWLGTFGGAVIRFDDKANSFATYAPDSHDPRRLNGGGITTIREDRTGTLWVGGFDGLYRYERQSGSFTRYTESQGLPSSSVRCIRDDSAGRLWLSTQKGVSRFDPKTQTFRNYDVYDGLQSDEFSDGCYQNREGEIFFGGSNGFNAFVPENVHDNPYVPEVAITGFRIFNKPAPIGGEVLKKAIPYVNSLALSYRDNVFSLEFAALSYANSHKNRYRYQLQNFDRGWTEVGSRQRVATYTNLDPGRYVFRVQGSNSDGVWNEQGVSLPILITPPWYRENWFRVLSFAAFLTFLWAAYRFRVRQLQHEFNMRVEARVEERTRLARELHDTLLQSFQASLILMQAARNMFAREPEKAVRRLDDAISVTGAAVAEGRNAIQNLRAQPTDSGDLVQLLAAEARELANSAGENPPALGVTVEGERRDIKPLLQDEVYRIAAELLRNAFQHSHASRIELEIRYESRWLRLHVRDDGKGIDPEILKAGRRAGHWGLPGVRERARGIGGELDFWSEAAAGTEARLTIPAEAAYRERRGGGLFSSLRRKKTSA